MLAGTLLLVVMLPAIAFVFSNRGKKTAPKSAPLDPMDTLGSSDSPNPSKVAMAAITAEPGAAPAGDAGAGQGSAALAELKRKILHVAALTDRGQRHLKIVSDAMKDREDMMKDLVKELVDNHPCYISEQKVAGKWELVYSSVELFRSSPFFLAIEQAFNDPSKSDLFFKLHLLQVGSWGVSTIGEVSQRIDFEKETMESDFDTTIFGLTVIPIVGWFKLLPTFGGRVVTEAKNLKLEGDMLSMELERTQVINAPGVPRIPFVAGAVMDKWVPVNAVWQLLPWNKEKPTCSVRLLYVDDDFRVVEDQTGGLFIYMRPVAGSA
jgi:hypothetical protein